MNTFADLVQLARICMRQARIAQSRDVADVLRQMAAEYQDKAAKLRDGAVPDIGELPDIEDRLPDARPREAARR
jgi:hypothetical protein